MKLITALAVACSAAMTAAPAGAAQDTFLGVSNPDLSIDMLYQHRSIIGTTPENHAWSADGSTVAFVWNDEGYSFRDVWSYDVASGTLSRLTFHGQERGPDDEDRGVSEALPLDGGRLAYVLDGALHLQDADGNARRIESDKSAIRRLTLEPGGDHLAFISGGAVDGRQDRFLPGGGLWARRADAQGDVEAVLLAGDENPKIYVHEYRWAPDGGAVAFNQADNTAMPERDIYYYADGGLQQYTVTRAFPGEETTRFMVGVASLEGGSARLFERPDPRHHVWGFGLSEDGARLFINSSDMLVKDHTVYVYDVDSGAREVAYHEHDPLHLRPDWQVEWAPGDEGLIILTDREGFLHLYHQPEAGGEVEQLTQGEWEIAQFWVDRTQSLLYFSANEASLPERQIYRVPLTGGDIERVSGETPGSHEPVFAPGHAHAASFFSNDATPPELYVLDLSGTGAHSQVTDSPQPEFHDQTWADIGYVEFESHVDGVTLIGRLSLPADHDPSLRYPLIVGSVYSDAVRNQWGGRRAHPTWGLDQYFVAQGYIVLNVNMRGSWGQGRAHNQGLHHDYGGIDIEDIESGVRHLVAEGYADPDRVAVWGSSYGGLMTLMSLAKKPGIYAAGIAGAPATNVWHAYPSQMWVMGEPEGEDMPDRYERQSALFQSQGIEDPVMIIHGSRDQVVLYSDTIAFTERLIENEQMFELVTLPGGSHSWATDSLAQTRFAFKKMAEFFDRNLKH